MKPFAIITCVTIYGRDTCGWTQKAKQWAQSLKGSLQNFCYRYKDIEHIGKDRLQILRHKNHGTLPAIFITVRWPETGKENTIFIGGYQDLIKLTQQGASRPRAKAVTRRRS